jgi:hypothetical protein
MAATATILHDLFHGEKRNKRDAPSRGTGFPRASLVPGACAASATSRLLARSRHATPCSARKIPSSEFIRESTGTALVIAAE